MFTIKQPSEIIFGKNSALKYDFPKKSLLITSSGAEKRDWFSNVNLDTNLIFNHVESNPSIETTNNIIKKFESYDFSTVVGLGGGSVLDVAKYVGYKLKKSKILVPTNFGSGSEVTRISVLKVDGKKKSFHNDELFADMIARAVDNEPQMVASTYVALGLRLYRSALPKNEYERLLKTFFEMAKDIQPFQEGLIKETLH